VATLKAIYLSQGYSDRAAEAIARPQRVSTMNLYQSRWSLFLKWLDAEGVLPDQVTPQIFADFLCHLFDSGLVPDTIKGYRASLGQVYKALGRFDAALDSHISCMIRHFSVQRPRKRVTMPKWDLARVLRSFLHSPYVQDGSDKHIPLKWFTIKTVFLVALATGRRVSCIRSLAYEFIVGKGASHSQVLSLVTLPEFRAKNQGSKARPERLLLPGMAHLVPHDPERFLCPVRALRMYAHRTAEMHAGIHRLFLNWVPGLSEIKTSHISRWIILAIKQAYTDADLQLGPRPAHEVRALAASWAYTNHVCLDDIKTACYWKSDNVFQDFYLRSMSSVKEGLQRLGPVVAAGSVIESNDSHDV